MKKLLLQITALAIFSMLVTPIIGQNTITFDPSALEPDDNGYYVAGVWVDEDNDGVQEFHSGCEDYYEDEDMSDGYNPDLNHKETGTQQEFYYQNCMIMPDCTIKGTAIDPPVPDGFIQMHACLFSGTDSAVYSYIKTPAISNLTSFTIETSTDVSIGDHRAIVYVLEYSKDNGTTWEEDTYVIENILNQGGHRVTYDGQTHLEIQEMIDASKTSPIVIRIITNDRAGVPTGQYVNVHSFEINADKASGLNTKVQDQLKITVLNKTIISDNNFIEVFNQMGQSIGKGQEVKVPKSGIYFVRDQENSTKKVFVN